jgi:hypothetical protein
MRCTYNLETVITEADEEAHDAAIVQMHRVPIACMKTIRGNVFVHLGCRLIRLIASWTRARHRRISLATHAKLKHR